MSSPGKPRPWNAYGEVRGLNAPPRIIAAPWRLAMSADSIICRRVSTAHGPMARTNRSPPIAAEHLEMIGVRAHLLEGDLDARVVDLPLEIDVELILPRRVDARAALQLGQIDTLRVEALQALEQRAAAMIHREHQRGLRRAAWIERLRLPPDEEEARQVRRL